MPEIKSMGLLETFDEDGAPFICYADRHFDEIDFLMALWRETTVEPNSKGALKVLEYASTYMLYDIVYDLFEKYITDPSLYDLVVNKMQPIRESEMNPFFSAYLGRKGFSF